VKSEYYQVPPYVTVSILLLPPLSYVLIFSFTLPSQNYSICYSLKVRDYIPHIYKPRGKIIILYVNELHRTVKGKVVRVL
jgi:hypothetical protein